MIQGVGDRHDGDEDRAQSSGDGSVHLPLDLHTDVTAGVYRSVPIIKTCSHYSWREHERLKPEPLI